jgi:hypothetical protein
MPADDINAYLRTQLDDLKAKGLYKAERRITSPQKSGITVNGQEVVNFCANNYLGLANHPEIVSASFEGLKTWGYGLSSVRFICGTQDRHKELEAAISKFLGTEDTILYGSCFDANGGLFETVLGEQDAIISDALNHASIIDGVRLCKAQRWRYAHNDLADLERCLNDPALDPFAAAVYEADFAQAGPTGSHDVLIDNRTDVSRLKGVEVDLGLDGQAMHVSLLSSFFLRPSYFLYVAVTVVLMPPRTEKSPTMVMRRGPHAATRSSRIWLVTAS